jgi:Phosphotransferase enzyme family
VILEVRQILERLLPDKVAGRAVSLVRIRTTRPIYLAFLPDARWPSFAVQFGPRDELLALHHVLTVLHRALPDETAAPLALGPAGDAGWVLVQEGLPGIPWFRLRETMRDSRQWLDLRRRALASLQRFHRAVSEQPEWCREVDVAEELERQVHEFLQQRVVLPGTAEQLGDAVESLRTLGRCPSFNQHGDFCLNNLLISGERLGIIDFEEFGQTAVPLHDEFSLALSFHEFMAAYASGPTLREHLTVCTAATLSTRAELLPHTRSLLLHHLLWRINQCRERPTRAALQESLLHRLAEVLAMPAGRTLLTPAIERTTDR